MTLTDDELLAAVASTYVALADLLESLPAEDWDAPSTCEGWRVREVVAHVTMPARYTEAAFMAELSSDGFDFTKLSNRIASRDAERSTGDLVANLRDEVLHRWSPPGGGPHDALNHAVIHALDITVPLGEPRPASDVAMRVVLDDLTEGGGHDHFGTTIDGLKLQATDIRWSHGSGAEVRGTAADIALHLCGRAVPTDRLHREP